MQALPSAFFHQVSSASRILVPRAWMAKSTMVVVPPMAAARVPVSKSSLEVVPPKGMSRWVCASMPPGSNSMPEASNCSWPSGEMPARTSVTVAPSINTSAAKVFSADTTVPFLMRVPIHQIFPGLRRQMIFHALHRDAVLYWTNQRAEIAAHAFVLVDTRHARLRAVGSYAAIELWNGRHGNARAARRFESRGYGMRGVHMNALMSAIPAGDVT